GDRRQRGAPEAAREAVPARDLGLEHGAHDRAAAPEGGPRGHEAEGDALHHDHRREQDRERDRGEEGRRLELHRQAVQRRYPEGEAEQRPGSLLTMVAQTDPAMVADVVRQVVSTLQGDLTPADLKLFHEIEELSQYIARARREIAELRTEEIRAHHIPAATDELDAIVAATEEATGSILDSAERIEEVATSLDGPNEQALSEAVTRIYEACNFQDITGQRISKVVKTLKHIELKVDNLVQAFGGYAAAQETIRRPGPL